MFQNIPRQNALVRQFVVPSRSPAAVSAPATPTPPSNPFVRNPFLQAMNTESATFMKTFGVNLPLVQPTFLGYHGERPVYAGSQLFVLA